MSENELVPVNFEQLPSTQVGRDDQYDELAKSSEFLGRLQLYTKGKAINKNQVKPGHYGIPEGEDVTDLGDMIDLYVLARRPKAIDMTDTDAILVSYDPDCEEFNRIKEQSMEKESHCMFGPSFLVYERTQKRFLEFFCGSKSTRSEAKKIYPFLPLTDADIARQKDAGNDVSDLQAHGPIEMTLKSRLVEKGSYSWHVPVVVKSSKPFPLPTFQPAVAEINKFLDCTGDGVELAKPVNTGKKQRAR